MTQNRDQAAYKDLLVWQRGMDFANNVIKAIDEMETPRKHFRLIEQLESAVTSIPLNIAEGMRSTLMVKADHQRKSLSNSYTSLVDLLMKH